MRVEAIAWFVGILWFASAVQVSGAGRDSCTDITMLDVADTSIETAEWVAAGAFEAPQSKRPKAGFLELPKFCRVTGSIKPTPESDIRFELWLPQPEQWNSKFLQTGNGGAAGSIDYYSLIDPLARGYAVANTDTGHVGGNADFSWAVDQPEKLIDYQYRATHELTRVGKAITAAHYDHAPDKSYWLGCSTGGRQGLKEAQRYPEDYDAVVAGAPASNWIALKAFSVLKENNVGPNGIAANKLQLLKEAAIAACDTNDGVADRVITEPGKCGFDPASLACPNEAGAECLSTAEIAAANRVYAGVVNNAGEILMPGTGPGSEILWQAHMWGFNIGTSYLRHVVFNDPEWDPATFDIESDLALARSQDAGATDAMDPDLSAFVERDGKLIVFHGTTDGLIPYGNSVNYHESVIDALGQETVDDNVRLYLLPGIDHCDGGEGAGNVDFLSALENWVERGQAPGALNAEYIGSVQSKSGASAATREPFTRIVCPYPQVARYKGTGDEDNATNYSCMMPEQE